MSSGDMFPEYKCCNVNVVLGHRPTCKNFVVVVGSICPDGGTCHHQCSDGCWRVNTCAPLSWAEFPKDEWPDDVKQEHRNSRGVL